ncbi:MAG TPA: S-layer protein domain-containing protein [Candidatus Methanoperedens sp.]
MDKRSGFELVPIFVIVLLASGAQAAAPVSAPESRFVWEPGENLTFTWTPANFDGFYYEPGNRAGNESLTIRLDKLQNRSVQPNGIVYFKKPGQTNTRYRLSGKYAVLEFTREKYLAEYPEDKSDTPIRLHRILIDDNTSHKVMNGSRLPLSYGHDIEVRDVNLSDSSVLLSLKMNGIDVNTRRLGAGENLIYEGKDGQIIAVHVDSVIAGGEEKSVLLSGIFQTLEIFEDYRNDDIFGVMKVTDISDTGITMIKRDVHVNLKPGSIIGIVDDIKLKVANSSTLRFYLYHDPGMATNEYRGAMHTNLNNLTAWDGLNYAGFWYDIDSGNYSESLEITNISGRRIPESGLTYASYKLKVPYAVTNINGIKLPGTDWSYETFGLGGNKYAVKGNGFARILIAHGDSMSEKKALAIEPYAIKGETWELGEGYALTVTSVILNENPRKARLVLSRNGVELEDIWLPSGNAYKYFSTGETGIPKLITYLDAVFAGATVDMIQLRYTWFVSDEVTLIKEGDRLGVFNVTVVEPDRMVLKNREPIDLKAGSSINLFGNLSFSVENSDELRFYPTSVAGTQLIPEEVTENAVPKTPDVITPVGTFPVVGRTERAAGFEVVISITIILAAYLTGRVMK